MAHCPRRLSVGPPAYEAIHRHVEHERFFGLSGHQFLSQTAIRGLVHVAGPFDIPVAGAEAVWGNWGAFEFPAQLHDPLPGTVDGSRGL